MAFHGCPHYWGMNGPLWDSRLPGSFSDVSLESPGQNCMPTMCLHALLEHITCSLLGPSARVGFSFHCLFGGFLLSTLFRYGGHSHELELPIPKALWRGRHLGSVGKIETVKRVTEIQETEGTQAELSLL